MVPEIDMRMAAGAAPTRQELTAEG